MDALTVAFLNVGQGDSAVLVLPDGSSAIVVDCAFNASVTVDYLQHKQINLIECVYITHTDWDHIGGAANLIANYARVNLVAFNIDVIPASKYGNRGKRNLRSLLKLIEKGGIPTEGPRADQTVLIQNVLVEVIHPTDINLKICSLDGDTNNASVVLLVTFAGRRILLAADIQGRGWQWIRARKVDLRANVLKFPHHGAWYEPKAGEPSLNEIVKEVDPDLVILSVGTRNSHDHPHQTTLDLLSAQSNLRFVCTQATQKCHVALAKLTSRATACAGTIEVTLGNEGLTVNPDVSKHQAVIQTFDDPQCRRFAG